MEPKCEAETVQLMVDNDSEISFEHELEQNARRKAHSCLSNKHAVLLHATLIAIYTTVFGLLSRRSQQCSLTSSRSLIYCTVTYCSNIRGPMADYHVAPAQEAVSLTTHRFNAQLVIESDYIGDPTPESDLAWHNLLQNMNIALPASEIEKIHSRSIAVPGRPDLYIAGLSVYHELHCLKRLRQYTWLDVYFPNQTAEASRLHRLHTDHCIDVLRQAIICHADTTLFTLQWSEAQSAPRADFSHQHQCVDWEKLNAWAGERAISDETMNMLRHPLFGTAFPDGEGSRLGASEDLSRTVLEDKS